jgi:hypothetical protein
LLVFALVLFPAVAWAQDEGSDDSAGDGGESVEVEASSDEEMSGPGLQRSSRMEFDGRLIRGETARAGAVFLFERVPRPLPSMVKLRESYVSDSVSDVFPDAQQRPMTEPGVMDEKGNVELPPEVEQPEAPVKKPKKSKRSKSKKGKSR